MSSISSGLHDLLQFLMLGGGYDRNKRVLNQAVLAVADLPRLVDLVAFICKQCLEIAGFLVLCF